MADRTKIEWTDATRRGQASAAARALAERVHATYLATPTDPTEGENHE